MKNKIPWYVKARRDNKRHWFINAESKPVFTDNKDSIGYRGPYTKKEVSELTGTSCDFLKTT